jgi:hypothetical protein
MPDAHTYRAYLPGFSHEWLLPLYDPLSKWLGIESGDRLPALMKEAGLDNPRQLAEGRLTMGLRLAYFQTPAP